MAREKQADKIAALESNMAAIMGMLQSITGGSATTAQTTPVTTVAKPAKPVTVLPTVKPVQIQANGDTFVLSAQNQFAFRTSSNGNPMSGSHGWEKVVDTTTGKQYKVNVMIMEA